jgi:hypothetical protein
VHVEVGEAVAHRSRSTHLPQVLVHILWTNYRGVISSVPYK